ncbi:hypothetical protein P4O66_012382, partial [Electrophorus voltai]
RTSYVMIGVLLCRGRDSCGERKARCGTRSDTIRAFSHRPIGAQDEEETEAAAGTVTAPLRILSALPAPSTMALTICTRFTDEYQLFEELGKPRQLTEMTGMRNVNEATSLFCNAVGSASVFRSQ